MRWRCALFTHPVFWHLLSWWTAHDLANTPALQGKDTTDQQLPAAHSCIEWLKIQTTSGAELSIGNWSPGAVWITAPTADAFVYSVRGYAGSNGLCQLQLTWAEGEHKHSRRRCCLDCRTQALKIPRAHMFPICV